MRATFVRFNANPWKKNIPDCSIRAISLALNMAYTKVCQRLGVAWRKGLGLVRKDGAATFEKIEKTFREFVDRYEEDPSYYKPLRGGKKDIFIDEESGLTLREWIELYYGNGMFLVGLRRNLEKDLERGSGNDDWHMVVVNTNNLKYFDSWDCGDMLVYAYYHLKQGKRLKDENPQSRLAEKKKFGLPLPAPKQK